MKLKISYLILFTLIVNIYSANATIRFVSKTGTSTPPYTSWETSADSIQKCINICSFGDTIYVANGVYKENLVINTAISLIGSSMDSTMIDGTGLNDMTVTFNVSGLINNFNILGKGEDFLTSRAVIAIGLYINIEINNCRISETGAGVSLSGDLLASNLIMENMTRGFNLFGNTSNTIKNSSIILERTNAIGISIGFSPTVDHYLYNSIIIFSGIYGNGLEIAAPKNVHLYNNLISGFSNNIFTDSPDSVFIRNNLLINQYSMSSGPASINTGGGRTITNNLILTKNKKAIWGDNRVTSDYNLFWLNQTNLDGITFGDSDIIVDPMFVSDTMPIANGNYDFHLQKYSPAIDKGNPDVLDLDGTRSDIGMYGGPFGESYTYQDLAPLAPRNLSAIVDSNNIMVRWNRNTEADTSHYNVYRDTVINFTIDSTKLVSSSADTFFVQPNPHIITRFVYKVTCVDNQGIESLPSAEIVVDITSLTDDEYPMTISDYLLYQNYPNPFNPSTKIGYQLKERAYVKLMVYDIKGELVSVLVNKEQNAGYYEVDFNAVVRGEKQEVRNNFASGIYLYRIEVIGEGNIPVYTEMKKMLLIK